MAPSPLFAELLLASAFLSISSCASLRGSPSAGLPQDTGASEYEVYNPASCEASVFTVDETGLNREALGTVPSGARLIFHVLPLPRGTRVAAQAVAADGSDCERAARVQVRRLGAG
jgi:hypothetical protein